MQFAAVVYSPHLEYLDCSDFFFSLFYVVKYDYAVCQECLDIQSADCVRFADLAQKN